MPKQSTEPPVEKPELEPYVKINVLGYDVEVPKDHDVAQLHAFVRALKTFHKQHRLSHPITITMPSWYPALLRE